jgi:hypothetical protein
MRSRKEFEKPKRAQELKDVKDQGLKSKRFSPVSIFNLRKIGRNKTHLKRMVPL